MYMCIYVYMDKWINVFMYICRHIHTVCIHIYIYIGFPKDHTPDKLQLVKDLVSWTVLQHVLILRIYRNGRSQFLFHGQE